MIIEKLRQYHILHNISCCYYRYNKITKMLTFKFFCFNYPQIDKRKLNKKKYYIGTYISYFSNDK